ncbi:hypothetical protein B9G69_012370 [Bdellovibrio sp. SKB1291214]|uniref:hypothetical protein n=1 Tax=Bdellovibrio sp. SKB1291214 TaxID=1732569 RepID=UPI000B518414|nr:hypothetical protein [Bdellovibrio sp. SKB1291214]UYL07841.1 hypothetical protein B9G69_012370 [Bdellovibrio sp. SKB1291214]
MKSIFSVMIVALAVVGCNSSSGGGGGPAPANEVYPQGTVIGPYEPGQGPQNGQYGQSIQPGTYDAEIRCDNHARITDVAIEFSLRQDGGYTQSIFNVEDRCWQNCTMIGEGTYSATANSITFNQTRLVNEAGGMLQGPRNNILQMDMSAPAPRPRRGKPSTKTIVLRDNGTENVCGGPFSMILKKQSVRRH